MPPRGEGASVVRIVEGVRGRVPMRNDLRIRFDYGHVAPWVRRLDGDLEAIAGPDAVWLHTPAAEQFTVGEGETVPFVLTWRESHLPRPRPIDARAALETTTTFWTDWIGRCAYDGEWRDAVHRSLLTLKTLTYAPTGGIVAAVTTSLPEVLGGVRNWDYRYCWLRDATITLEALLYCGYVEEARDWRNWLLRAIAGDPADLQIMYGVAGERRLTEWTADWLPGYGGAGPLRIGNAAAAQFQLDVYGEVMDVMHRARLAGLEPDATAWDLHTHSKLMAWVAADRAVCAVEECGVDGPVDQWRALRAEIRDDVLTYGFDAGRNTFTQFYGSTELDAALLTMPLVGFLPADDPRMLGTVAAIERELLRDGLVQRYTPAAHVDGLPEGDGAFLACSFWLAQNYALAGRTDDAKALFTRLLWLRNDVGLLSEEYDPAAGRQVGNFPQAFSHVPLIETARTLS